MRLIFAIISNAVALFATTIVPGIVFRGSLVQLLAAGAILGLFNLIVRPIATFLSFPLLIVTLGLFYVVLNGVLLWGAAQVIPGYAVTGLVPGILGGIVLGLVNWALHALFAPGRRDDKD
jgi:putative membrane protein